MNMEYASEGRAGLDAGEPRTHAADGIPQPLATRAGTHPAIRTASAARGASLQDGDLNAGPRRLRRRLISGLRGAGGAVGGEPR